MTDFTSENLTGARFEDVYLTGARFRSAARRGRGATVRRVIGDLADAMLAGTTEPVVEPGYPGSESFAVRRCLQAMISEEWEHGLYAERDFDVLESRSS